MKKTVPSSDILPVSVDYEWQSHVRGLFDEIRQNPQCAIMDKPLRITYGILQQVAQRALELDDPKLNILMCRLAMYSFSDPYDKDYNGKVLAAVKSGKSLAKIQKMHRKGEL